MNFRLLGFPVSVDPNVGLIGLMWLAFGLRNHEPMPIAIGGVLILFASILWHELGHAFAARGFGLGPIDIALHGFGGLTRHRPSGKPWKDLLVTLAGPGNGLLLGVVALVAGQLVHGDLLARLIGELALVNLFWSVFNLMPMFPMDGGQALYAVLRITAPRNAHRITGGIGLAVAALLMAFAVMSLISGGATSIFIGYFAFTSGQRCWQLLNARA